MDKLKELLRKSLGDQYTDDVDQQVEDAVEEHAQAQVESETSKLRKNNERLTKQLKDARAGQGTGDTSELEEKIDALEQEKAKIEKEAEKLRKSYDKDTKQLQEQLQSEQGAVSQMVVDQGIRKALADAGVSQTKIEYLVPYFKGSAKVKSENGSREAVIEAQDDKGGSVEKPLGEHINAWAQTDAAKEFIKAQANSGGGATGNGGTSGNDKTITRAQFNELGHADRAAFARDGGKVVNED